MLFEIYVEKLEGLKVWLVYDPKPTQEFDVKVVEHSHN